MKTLIFEVAGYNLAETGRHIEIAKACKDFFNIIFLSYGGNFESLIEEESFTLKKMDPRYSLLDPRYQIPDTRYQVPDTRS